jgi:hypothetical protein
MFAMCFTATADVGMAVGDGVDVAVGVVATGYVVVHPAPAIARTSARMANVRIMDLI